MCPLLEALDLDDSGITDLSLLCLGLKCGNLRTLLLRDSLFITDAGIQAVIEGCKLIELRIEGCAKVTARLKQAMVDYQNQ
jgi:hypothetical protein